MIGRSMIVALLLSLVGCGVQATRDSARPMAREYDSATTASDGPAAAGDEAIPAEDFVPEAAGDRKIIYEANLSLVVEDFTAAREALPKLVSEHGGYLADVTIDRETGLRRSGRWQARIPVAKFDPFLDAVTKLGIPQNRRQTAQDVTEEFVDLEARIANKRRLEARILELLEESEGKIKDVLEVERELARVRTEIEQMEGRLRFLKNRTSLSTITVAIEEERDYVPPEAPSFTGRIRRAWSDSLLALREFGENAAVFLVAAAPWLVLFGVLFGVLFLPLLAWIRRRWRRARSGTSGPT